MKGFLSRISAKQEVKLSFGLLTTPKKSCLCFSFHMSLIPPTSLAKGLGLVRHWRLIKQDFPSAVGRRRLTPSHAGEA